LGRFDFEVILGRHTIMMKEVIAAMTNTIGANAQEPKLLGLGSRAAWSVAVKLALNGTNCTNISFTYVL